MPPMTDRSPPLGVRKISSWLPPTARLPSHVGAPFADLKSQTVWLDALDFLAWFACVPL